MRHWIDAAFFTLLLCGVAWAANYNMPLTCDEVGKTCVFTLTAATTPPVEPPPGGGAKPVAPVTVGALTFEDLFTDIHASISDSQTRDGNKKWWTQTVYCCTGGQLSKIDQSDSAYQQLSGGGLRIAVPRAGGGIIATYAPDNSAGFTQTYGYFEMNAKLPGISGAWPAFWMVNYGNPCVHNWQDNSKCMIAPGAIGPFEIDQMEGFQIGGTDYYQISNHDWGSGGGHPTLTYHSGKDLTAGYHTYGVLWKPGKLEFYLDATKAWEIPTHANQVSPAYMILDNGPNTPYSYNTQSQHQPSEFDIKWVRAWALPAADVSAAQATSTSARPMNREMFRYKKAE